MQTGDEGQLLLGSRLGRGQARADAPRGLEARRRFGRMEVFSKGTCIGPQGAHQAEFDHALWCSDLNMVRGEDSLVRALWAGRPLVWHIYPQDDGAHHAKLQAFLDWLKAPVDMRAQHLFWNADTPARLPHHDARTWTDTVRRARHTLLAQDDLVSQLIAQVQRLG